jgi:DNA phosphorothioation-dependent restriction protein DptH
LFESDAQKTKPLYDLIDGVTVVHLSGYDENIQNLIVAMTLDLFYSQMQITGHSRINGNLREITKLILVDEADNFLSQNFSSIRKILKEGREFGVGTILSTQFLNHFSTGENEYSDYIESWIVHKVPNTTGKEVRKIFGTSNKTEEDELISQISELEKHYSLVKTGNQEVKHIKDLAFWELVEEKNKKWY